MKFNLKNKKVKDYIAKIIMTFLVISVLILPRELINLYNEKTAIDVRTKEIKELYSNYESINQQIIKILDKICIKENDIYILKNEYTENKNYSYFNSIILIISNILNSNTNLLDKNNNKIHYEQIMFDKRMAMYKQRIQPLINNNYNNIINSYVKSIINILSIDFDDSYYNTRRNKLFNINGRKEIYNDYMILLQVEYEITNMMYNIIQYIQGEI